LSGAVGVGDVHLKEEEAPRGPSTSDLGGDALPVSSRDIVDYNV
jgi:hypothetical protein